MLLDGLDENLDVLSGVGSLTQLFYQALVLFRAYAARAAVSNIPFGVHSREVKAGRHVPGGQLKIDSQRRENSPADVVFYRIVSEKRHVRRTTARCDARPHRLEQTAGGVASQRVQVGGAGSRELRVAPGLHGQAAESIRDEKQYFSIALFLEFFNYFYQFFAHEDPPRIYPLTNGLSICIITQRGGDYKREFLSRSLRSECIRNSLRFADCRASNAFRCYPRKRRDPA